MLDCSHAVEWEKLFIIVIESNHYLLETKRSFLIKRDSPSLSRDKYLQAISAG